MLPFKGRRRGWVSHPGSKMEDYVCITANRWCGGYGTGDPSPQRKTIKLFITLTKQAINYRKIHRFSLSLRGRRPWQSPLSIDAGTIQQEIPTSPSEIYCMIAAGNHSYPNRFATRNDKFVRFMLLLTKTDNHNDNLPQESYPILRKQLQGAMIAPKDGMKYELCKLRTLSPAVRRGPDGGRIGLLPLSRDSAGGESYGPQMGGACPGGEWR